MDVEASLLWVPFRERICIDFAIVAEGKVSLIGLVVVLLVCITKGTVTRPLFELRCTIFTSQSMEHLVLLIHDLLKINSCAVCPGCAI